ncbi:hypothetical protein J4221_01455 [Candidatus Pacearchaeota archaeon]|nr:hypothetical protein [Candidatus Pacearchaeota archaeon]
MVRYVVTVKIGGFEEREGGFFKVIGITIRDTVTGKIMGTTYSGPEDLVRSFLESLESNPEWKVKYE